MQFNIIVATEEHLKYVPNIVEEIEKASQDKNSGLAKRTPEYITEKIKKNNAVIALSEKGEWAGFCYIETWSNKEYVANSGLIVKDTFRKFGIAKRIKERIFLHSREKYPEAKIFGLTTSLAVMKINSDLGYRPVTYSELTQDDAFWKGCQSCSHYDILSRNTRRNCLCTGMLYIPKKQNPS